MGQGDDDDRPGGYSVKGGTARDVEVFGRRRIVRRPTPRLQLDPKTMDYVEASGVSEDILNARRK